MTLVIIIIGPSDTSQDFSEWGLSVLLVYWLAWQRLMLWYTSVELEVSPVVSALTSHWDQFKGPEQPRGPNSQTHSSHANPNVVNMMCVCVCGLYSTQYVGGGFIYMWVHPCVHWAPKCWCKQSWDAFNSMCQRLHEARTHSWCTKWKKNNINEG